MTYFNNVNTIEDLKKQYTKLVKQYHPDLNPNGLEDMKAVNNEYDELFKVYKNIHTAPNGEQYEKETTETPEEFREILFALFALDDIEVELCGRWLWITGNTKEHKETFKELKCRWSAKKSAWYWHKAGDTTFSKGGKSLDEIRLTYGSEKFNKPKYITA